MMQKYSYAYTIVYILQHMHSYLPKLFIWQKKDEQKLPSDILNSIASYYRCANVMGVLSSFDSLQPKLEKKLVVWKLNVHIVHNSSIKHLLRVGYSHSYMR